MTTSRRNILAAGAGLLAAACAGGGEGAEPTTTTGTPTSGPPGPATTTPTTATTTATTAAPAGPRFRSRAPGTPARVALTFHTDGSEDLAGRLVEELARTATPVTCFMVGRWLDAHPSWATRLHQTGHELANHTYTHPTSGRLTGSALQADITRCRDALVRLTGAPGRFFRVSGTDDGVTLPTPTILAASVAAGYTELAGYDVDPADYQDPGSAQVVSRTLAAVKPGSIVSLHFGHAGTVEAVPQILAGLHQRGLQPVTLTDLLGP